MIRLGYVSLNTTLPTPSKTFRLENYSRAKMLEYTKVNLDALRKILEWNKGQNIRVFRLTSGFVPFGSSPINDGSWKEVLKSDFVEIGNFIKANDMRISVHPGQYTVLNSPIRQVFENSVNDLIYHNDLLTAFGLDISHHIILHGGGAFQDKEKSTKILVERFFSLPEEIRDRLAFENDDRVFTAKEILQICEKTKTRAVFDYFHHQILPSFNELNTKEIILKFKQTWPVNSRQEIHYSNQDKNKKPGAHSQTIDASQFGQFYDEIKDIDLDIVLETKDKEQSLLKLRRKFLNLN